MKKQKNFKKINKFISKAIIGTMIISNMIPSIAFANEIQEVTENGERETLVTYEANAYFAVTIPKHITLDGITKSAEYNINVRGDIPSDAKVIVSPEDKISNVEGINFYMVEQAVNKKEDVVATVTQNETEWSSSEVTSTGTSKNGFISAPNLTSGKWQGTFIFNISLLDNSKDHTHNYVDGVCIECGEKDPNVEDHTHNYIDGICTKCGEKDPNVEDHTHNYIDGICTECGEKDPSVEEHTHNYTESITKEATCTESGEKTLTCSCGDTKTEVIPMIEHNYVDGVCIECNDVDANYVPTIDELEDGNEYGIGKSITLKQNQTLKVNGTSVSLTNDTFTFDTEGVYTVTVTAPNGNEFTLTVTITHVHNYEDGFCTICGEANKSMFSEAGLYTASGKQLATWLELTEDYGFDVSQDVTSSTTKGTSVLQGTALNPNNSAYVLVVKDGVTHIGNYAFFKCDKLKSIILPDSVESIGDHAFNQCTGLINVTIPDSVTSIGNNAFYHCTGLTNLIISNNITIIEKNTFYNCTSLKSITIPENVTSIGQYAFYSSGLESINVPDKVATIDYNAFKNCANLKSVYVGNGNTKIDSSAFNDCSNLESAVFESGDVLCSFTNCDKLTYLKYEANVTTIKHPSAKILDNIIVDENNQTYCSVDGIVFSKDMSELIAAPAGKQYGTYSIPESVTTIKIQAFEYCSNLTEVIITENVKTIEDSAFGCSGLISINIPDNVTSVGYAAFSRCKSLTKAEISGTIGEIPNSMFNYCDLLSDVTINEGITAINDRAFEGCVSLKSIFIPNSVITMHRANTGCMPFYQCNSSLKIYCERSSKASGWDSNWSAYNATVNSSGQITGTSNATVKYNVTREVYESTYKN